MYKRQLVWKWEQQSYDVPLLSKLTTRQKKDLKTIEQRLTEFQNLKTWKHNTGYTPELGGTAIAFGVDDGSYPMPAIYTFGFNLTF